MEKRLRAVYKTLHWIIFVKETAKKIQVETKRVPQGHLGGSMDAYRPLSLSLAHKLTQLGTTLFGSNNIVLSLLHSV